MLSCYDLCKSLQSDNPLLYGSIGGLGSSDNVSEKKMQMNYAFEEKNTVYVHGYKLSSLNTWFLLS